MYGGMQLSDYDKIYFIVIYDNNLLTMIIKT